MNWLERLRRIEEKSEFLEDRTAKTAKGPSYSFCSASSQESEVSHGDFRAATGGTDTAVAEWFEGVACLQTMPRPARVRPEIWQQIVADAARFFDRWGRQAAALSWSTRDLFGCQPNAPGRAHRLRRFGPAAARHRGCRRL